MRTMTKLLLVVVLAVMMPAIAHAAVLWGFESETGVSEYHPGSQGISSVTTDLVSSPITEGSNAARMQVTKSGGGVPYVLYQVARTWEDFTDLTFSFDIYLDEAASDMIDSMVVVLWDGDATARGLTLEQEWWGNLAAPTAEEWTTYTFTEGVGTTYQDAAFDPTSVGLIELGFVTTGNAQTAGTVYFDNFLVVEATLPGDFDADNDVDGADFGLWQSGYPTATGAVLGDGDADADGDVDGTDFGIWQANYPTNVGGAAAIPEPATLALFLIGGLTLLKRRQRH